MALLKKHGFTIVELLIVVVVISILAAITIVAYNGIQKRAVTASNVAAIDSLEKQIKLALIDGKLTNFTTNNSFICAGKSSDFPAGSGLAAGQCSTTGNYLTNANDPVYANDTLSATLEDAGVKLPGKMESAQRSGLEGSAPINSRGVAIYANSLEIHLFWYPPDISSCGRASNETEALIALIKSSPAATASYEDRFGSNWEDTVRTDIGGWCSLKIKK